MKFCYIDESGIGGRTYAVMVGVIVDAYRMGPTKEAWDSLLEILSKIVSRKVKEFHTKDFYLGNSPWRNLKGEQRAAVINAIFEWFSKRNHHIVYSALDIEKFLNHFSSEEFSKEIKTPWKFLALHITLSIQKYHQNFRRNKGHTVLIFDKYDREQKEFIELILNPPSWTDSYYKRKRNQKKLDQIVDVPHFVDSSHVGMIQLADCISYFLRRYIEIKENKVPSKYKDEEEKVSYWIELALKRSIPKSIIYPKQKRGKLADLFYRYAPESIKK